MILIDHAEDLRDYIVTARCAQGAAASAAAKQKQQQLKDAPVSAAVWMNEEAKNLS
jgi:hypothetical protein